MRISKKIVVAAVAIMTVCALNACKDDEDKKEKKSKEVETSSEMVEEESSEEIETVTRPVINELESTTDIFIEGEEETEESEEPGDIAIDMTGVKSEKLYSYRDGNWKLLKEIYYDGQGNITGEKIYNQRALEKYESERPDNYSNVTHVVRDLSDSVSKYYYSDNGDKLWYESYEYYYSDELTEMYEYKPMDTWIDEWYQHEYVYNTEQNQALEYCQIPLLTEEMGRAILYKGEVYIEITDSDKAFDIIYGEGSSEAFEQVKKDFPEYYIEGIGNIKCLKLNVSNVKAIYNQVYAQSAYSSGNLGIIIVHNDNTASFSLYEDLFEGNNEVIKLPFYNIVDVFNANVNAMITYFADENGEMVKVSDLVYEAKNH